MAINVGAIKRYKKGLCPKCGVKLQYSVVCSCPQCGEEWNGDKVLDRYFNLKEEMEKELEQEAKWLYNFQR